MLLIKLSLPRFRNIIGPFKYQLDRSVQTTGSGLWALAQGEAGWGRGEGDRKHLVLCILCETSGGISYGKNF